MKQLVQSYRTGALSVLEVPAPTVRPGGLLVQTVATAISPGTERTKVELARASLFGKARARPDQLATLLGVLEREGPLAAYRKARSKLDRSSPLGYSAAGRVIAVGDGCAGFAVGDAVACGGAGYANHAEVLWVPSNLCAKVPDGVTLEHAAFTTLGAIALHAIRRADARFGETVAVIGLGLIGQLTVQLLRASGCRVIGVDVDPWRVALAQQHGVELALRRGDAVAGQARRFTDGRGADAIIITAATGTNDPLVLAGELARDRAPVVVVGDVPLQVPRAPYYERELDIRISRSYGPGRYDRTYEERGVDYPIGYVRWTENRNMQAFLRALEVKQVSLDRLITHRLPFAAADTAYDLRAPSLGVVLEYVDEPAPRISVITTRGRRAGAAASVGMIGAGSFACSTLLPILGNLPGVRLSKICSATGLSAHDAAGRYGVTRAVDTPADILDDDATNVVVIATRHDTHASFAAEALRKGKAVFVEKPLALDRAQLDEVLAAAGGNPRLAVGFNRRFSPHTVHARDALAGAGKLVIQMRVNAGPLADDSWIHDPSEGGGRVLGEMCHFIDLAQALAGARIKRVYATSQLRDNVCVNLELSDGSVASIAYTSLGDISLGKERIEVFGGGVAVVIDDFQSTTVQRNGRSERFRTRQDKGHTGELARFITMVTEGAPPPSAIADVRAASLAAIAATESLAHGGAVEIEERT